MHNDDSHDDGAEVVIRANAETTAAVLDELDGRVKDDAIRVEEAAPHAGGDPVTDGGVAGASVVSRVPSPVAEMLSEAGIYAILAAGGFLVVSAAILSSSLTTATAVLVGVCLVAFLLAGSTTSEVGFVFLAGAILAPTSGSLPGAAAGLGLLFVGVSGLKELDVDDAVRGVLRT